MKKIIFYVILSFSILIFTACFSESSSMKDDDNFNSESTVFSDNLSDEISISKSSGNEITDNMRNLLGTDFAILKTTESPKKHSENLLSLEIKGENLKGYLFQSIRKSKNEDIFAVSGMKFLIEKDGNGNFRSSQFYLEDMIQEIENEKIYSLSIKENEYNKDLLLQKISLKITMKKVPLNDLYKRNISKNFEKRIFINKVDINTNLKKIPNSAKRWSEKSHKSISSLCASQLGLSQDRIANIEEASFMPDIYQNGVSNGFNQQWSHAYMISSWGKHIWGDAHDDFYDNLLGEPGPDCEGYQNSSAVYYYTKNDQYTGDQYLGYALHYIEDASLTLHSSFPSFTAMDLLSKHFAFENWVNNNLVEGLFLLEDAFNDYYYYEVNDLKQAIHNTAYLSSVWTSDLGEKIWDEYRKCNYPEDSGQGSKKLARLSKQLLVQTTRYVKGTIIFALNNFDQWNNLY